MKVRILRGLCVLAALGIARPAVSQPFPPRGIDTFATSSRFSVFIYGPPPGFPGVSRYYWTTVWDDSTQVGRSDPTTEGNEGAEPTSTVPPCSACQDTVSDTDIPCWPPAPLRPPVQREIHTEMLRLDMIGTTSDGYLVEYLAGQPAYNALAAFPGGAAFYQNSFGEVESQDLTGDPNNDFPANSMWDLRGVVRITPPPGVTSGVFYTLAPVLMAIPNLPTLPPLSADEYTNVLGGANEGGGGAACGTLGVWLYDVMAPNVRAGWIASNLTHRSWAPPDSLPPPPPPNPNVGTLIVHDTGIVYSTGTPLPPVSTPPADCAGVDNELPLDNGSPSRIWKVYAAFLGGSSPRLKSVAWGIQYPEASTSPASYVNIAGNGSPQTGGPGDDFFVTTPLWPASGSSVGQVFLTTKLTTMVPLWYFYGWGHGGPPPIWSTAPHPNPANRFFSDDAVPPNTCPILGYGSLGFGTPGYTPCPVAPDPTGACCNTITGACTITTQAACQFIWLGANVTCNVATCPPEGPCCFPSGGCTITTQANCDTQYWIPGGVCGPNPCDQPSGSCCYPNGSCEVKLEALCTGVWTVYGVCTATTCVIEGVEGGELDGVLGIRAKPNPFLGTVSLRVAGPKATAARVLIFDPAGRLVRTAWTGILNGRAFTVTWDGRDDSGREAATGIYMVRLTSASGDAVERLVKTR